MPLDQESVRCLGIYRELSVVSLCGVLAPSRMAVGSEYAMSAIMKILVLVCMHVVLVVAMLIMGDDE